MNDLLFALRQLRKSPGFIFVITVRMSGLSVEHDGPCRMRPGLTQCG